MFLSIASGRILRHSSLSRHIAALSSCPLQAHSGVRKIHNTSLGYCVVCSQNSCKHTQLTENNGTKQARAQVQIRSFHAGQHCLAPKGKVKPVNMDFDYAFKQFLRSVHPDRLSRFPKQKKQNETSLQKLLSFIDEIKSTDSFPSRQTLLLTFEIPRGRSGAFKTINLKIRTSGGDCRRVVEDSILQCFNECDLNIKKLTWHEKYWNPKLPDRDEYYEYEE